MHKLYVKIDGEFKELAALAVGLVKPIEKVTISVAIETYIKNCTSAKCPKNQNSEKLYFLKLHDFLVIKGVEFMGDVTPVIIQEFEAELLKLTKVS